MDKAERRKVQILHAALSVVAELGFDHVTLQDIADRAGTSKGVISYYFDNKEDVLCQLLEWITDRIHRAERAALLSNPHFSGQLRALVNSVFASPEENRTFYKVYMDFLARAARHERYRLINGQFYANCLALTRQLIATGQSEMVVGNRDPEQAFVVLRSLIDGCLIQWIQTDRDDLHLYYRDTCFAGMFAYLTSGETPVAGTPVAESVRADQ